MIDKRANNYLLFEKSEKFSEQYFMPYLEHYCE